MEGVPDEDETCLSRGCSQGRQWKRKTRTPVTGRDRHPVWWPTTVRNTRSQVVDDGYGWDWGPTTGTVPTVGTGPLGSFRHSGSSRDARRPEGPFAEGPGVAFRPRRAARGPGLPLRQNEHRHLVGGCHLGIPTPPCTSTHHFPSGVPSTLRSGPSSHLFQRKKKGLEKVGYDVLGTLSRLDPASRGPDRRSAT